MKAMNPVAVRPVKVESLLGMEAEKVQAEILLNSRNGLIPKWKEIPEADTPEMDTETIFRSQTGDGLTLSLHQSTVPLPMDKFPNLLGKMSATRTLQYVQKICKREGWSMEYPNIMAVLNNLDMETA